MLFVTGLSAVLILALTASTTEIRRRVYVKYRFFDDYLRSLKGAEKDAVLEETFEVEIGSGEPLEANMLPFRTGIHRSKDEQCCMLGQLAGDKGFHCVAQFYAVRILHRNYNRAQNKVIPALHRGRPDPKADKLMRTFGQCVANRASIFNKCCLLAAKRSRL